jgi:Icc-related predicted phosphoesterase
MKLLIFSDIHNDLRSLERLMATEADYYFAAGDLVSFGRGLDACGELMKAKGERVYCLPGNHESSGDIERLCDRYGLRNFHEKTLAVGEYTVAGLGYSNPTPFNTPGEYTEAQLAERLAKFSGLAPLILICHTPPHGTRLDTIKPGAHAGSTAVGKFIQTEQPQYFFCGHIHEAAGVEERLGATTAVNVGKKGYLLELN